jgi:hypothetical protein
MADGEEKEVSATPDYRKQFSKATCQAIVLAVAIMAAWLLFAFLIPRNKDSPLFSGTYGDSFGFLTALFTGLALAGLWYTIQLQRIELSETRHVLEKQSGSLKKQSEAQERQLFEGTFFQLLRRLSDAQEGIRYGGDSGREAVKKIYEQYRASVVHKIRERDLGSNANEIKQQVLDTFVTHLRSNQSELNHYFRILYHVFKFVADSKLPEADQVRYANLARAQLSTFELCLLFYNGAVGEGAEGMKPLIEQFGLLKHVDRSLLLDPSHKTEWQLYKGQAFFNYESRKGVKVGVASGKRT